MRLRNRNTLIRVIFDQCSKLYSRICSRMFFGRSDKQRAPVIFQHCYSTDGQEPIKTVDKKRCKRLRNTNAHGSFLGCLDVEIRFFMLPVSGSRRRVLTLFTSRCFLLFPSFSLRLGKLFEAPWSVATDAYRYFYRIASSKIHSTFPRRLRMSAGELWNRSWRAQPTSRIEDEKEHRFSFSHAYSTTIYYYIIFVLTTCSYYYYNNTNYYIYIITISTLKKNLNLNINF